MRSPISSRSLLSAAAVLALAGALPAAATASATSAKPKSKPAARATPSLYPSGLFQVQGHPVTVPRRKVVVTGVVRPFVPHQWVTVRELLNGRQFATAKLRLRPSARRVYGGFTWPVRSPGVGTVSVVVEHQATSTLKGFKVATHFAALDTQVGFGSRGRFVELVQQRLAALHFWIPQTGVYDQGTGLAVDAYHRMLRSGYSELLGPATIDDLLNGVGSFHVRFPNQGRHAEGDLSDQLLALIDGSKVSYIFPISSGKPSTPTILGTFRVYSRVPGYLPDGMYYSDFFIRGYAIHGYNPAPDYPASHGCMRLPIVDAIPAFDWLAIGDWVDTYYT
jgi:L,D-transpeptidase catalytic domain